MKHNKKRNTAFIYETLTRELTKAIVTKNLKKKEKVFSIIREHFEPDSVLTQELRLYRVLLETKNIQSQLAEKILHETKVAHTRLNEKSIFDAQSRIIAAINKNLGQDAWANFVPNFKSLASVNGIFNPKASIKRRVLFEQAIVDEMSAAKDTVTASRLDPLDNITYNSFIKKFNDKYEALLKEQKELLNHFITSFADDGLELRVYLNEELGRIKGVVTQALEKEKVPLLSQKLAQVGEYLEELRKRETRDEDLHKLLTTQQLVRELSAHD